MTEMTDERLAMVRAYSSGHSAMFAGAARAMFPVLDECLDEIDRLRVEIARLRTAKQRLLNHILIVRGSKELPTHLTNCSWWDHSSSCDCKDALNPEPAP